MLDLNFIRKNQPAVENSIDKRHMSDIVSVKKILELDATVRRMQTEIEQMRARQNEISRLLPKAEDKQPLLSEAKDLKAKLKANEVEIEQPQKDLQALLSLVPNLISEEVPEGKDDTENQVIRSYGKKSVFNFQPLDHLTLGTNLDLIDVERAAKVTGSRFYYLKNEAVLLQFALVQLVFDTVTNPKTIKKLASKVGNPNFTPFSPVVPPVLMRPAVMKKMDRLDPIDERYMVKDGDDTLVLVGSAEHTMGSYYMDEVLPAAQLPVRFIGYSTAFRRESGSYGKDVRGILRTHQFDKLELESFSTADMGLLEQELMVAIQEYLMQALELPYQVVAVCSGDMGKPDFRQIDLEVYVPSEGKYRETHSSDYMTDYQSRRLNTRYDENGQKHFTHMNDATAFAIGRTLLAIFENYQNEDGSITVPKVLQKFVGKKVIKR